VVAESTGGAQPGERLGDLNVLWELEQGLGRQPIPAAINRAGYYMSNWDGYLEGARTTGRLPTLFPADLPIPMVAPRDLGEVAARRLQFPTSDSGIRYVEGPRLYSSRDVAQAFAKALGCPVEVVETPRDQWKQTFLDLGFSQASAESYARMIAVSVDNGFDQVADPLRGQTTLDEYVRALVVRDEERT
jgi:uncharacterized protein YbjT (DUF2867 family)